MLAPSPLDRGDSVPPSAAELEGGRFDGMRLRLLGMRSRFGKVGGPWPKVARNRNILAR